MAAMIQPPAAGEPIDQLWRKVAELTARLNIISNAEVKIVSKAPTTGRFVVTDDHAVFVLE